MERVLVAGSGVAAVETVLALRALAGPRVQIEVLAPAAELVHRPSSVSTPFGAAAASRIDLTALAGQLGLVLRRDSLCEVVPDAHQVLTRGGERRDYDALVVATGAPSRDAVHGAVTFRGPISAGAVEGVLARATADPRLRLVFAVPEGATWPLPIYELALLSAAALDDANLTIVTPEPAPLATVGAEASEALAAELERAGVDLLTDAVPAVAIDGALQLRDGRLVGADAVIALPELIGLGIAGLPHDDSGFIPVDAYGRVLGCDDVLAAGDATAFHIKHGSLATQQADAVAATIAARIGAIDQPEPFRPVLHGTLLTGRDPLYIRAEIGGRTTVSDEPLPDKLVGRYLSAFLAGALPLEHARHAAVDHMDDALGAGAGEEAGGHRGALT
jgi:sulfide:quinone oxidoreductase